MKKVVLIIVLTIITSFTLKIKAATPQKAPEDEIIKDWIGAMEQGKAVNVPPNFVYTRYSFTGEGKMMRSQGGRAPFFSLYSKPSEINVEEVKSTPAGKVVKLVTTSEEGLYRVWETYLLISEGKITRVTEVAIEGKFYGPKEECPETTIKRDHIATVTGVIQEGGLPNTIRLYSTRIDTGEPDIELEDKRKAERCGLKPGTYKIEEEVLIFDPSEQLIHAEVVADASGESQGREVGVRFAKEDEYNFPARLFDIGEKSGLLLTFTKGEESKAITQSVLYKIDGNLRPIWSFTAGFTSADAGANWELKSTSEDGVPMIKARLIHSSGKYNCSEGTVITFKKKGDKFEAVKGEFESSCLKMPKISSLKGYGKRINVPELSTATQNREE